MSEWISTQNRLPPNYKDILYVTIYGVILVGSREGSYFNEMNYRTNLHSIEKVTHWQHLPELPPKEENKMSNQKLDLDTVEKAFELLLEDLRVFKNGGSSLYDWDILDFGKYNNEIKEIIKGAIK